jgi:hypothetical protein
MAVVAGAAVAGDTVKAGTTAAITATAEITAIRRFIESILPPLVGLYLLTS